MSGVNEERRFSVDAVRNLLKRTKMKKKGKSKKANEDLTEVKEIGVSSLKGSPEATFPKTLKTNNHVEVCELLDLEFESDL